MNLIVLNLLLCRLLLLSNDHAIAATKNDHPVLSIGLIADIQYCDCDTHINGHYRKSLANLEEAIDELSQKNVDFVLI